MGSGGREGLKIGQVPLADGRRLLKFWVILLGLLQNSMKSAGIHNLC